MKYGLTEIAGRSIEVLPSKADLFNWLSETLAGQGCEIKRNETIRELRDEPWFPDSYLILEGADAIERHAKDTGKRIRE